MTLPIYLSTDTYLTIIIHHVDILDSVISDIKSIRKKLFLLNKKLIMMSIDEFNINWPYVNNIWCCQNVQTYSNCVVLNYLCCQYWKKWISVQKDFLVSWQCSVRAEQQCKVSFTVTHFLNESAVTLQWNSNWTKHTHTLKKIDCLKRNSKLCEIAVLKVSKNYSPITITQIMQKNNEMKNSDRAYMTQMNIQNAEQAWKQLNSDKHIAESKLSWLIQLAEAVNYLNLCGFDTQWLKIPIKDKLNSESVIFELLNQIKKLWCCEHLTIMNFTHCTNALRWYLYTMMVQDKFESWISVIHLLFTHENSDILKKALQQLKIWCMRGWNLYYMLIDDSATEQTAVKKAFLKLKAKKQKVNHLLCKVHSNCTLQRYTALLENCSLTALQTALWIQ